VEGISALATCGNDRLYHRIRPTTDIAGENTQQRNPIRHQPRFTSSILLGPITHIMSDPIDLDRQRDLVEIKIEHVRSGGMLPAEFIPARPQSQPRPQHNFRHAHSPP
jgi:hypothetical protein